MPVKCMRQAAPEALERGAVGCGLLQGSPGCHWALSSGQSQGQCPGVTAVSTVGWGGNSVMSSPDHVSGSHCILSLLSKISSEETNSALKLRGQAIAQWTRFRIWTQKCSVLTPRVLCHCYITNATIWGGFMRSMGFTWAICLEIIFTGNKCWTELCSWIVHFWFS